MHEVEKGNALNEGKPLLHLKTREEWRAWLERNHDKSDGVWFVSWKKATGRPVIPYTNAVDEALCFGWIDSKVKRLDEERAMRMFTPRNPKSQWSRINKNKVARLLEQGLMTAAGMKFVKAAKADGSWNVSDEIEDLVIPPDLASALAENHAAGEYFRNLPDSWKKSSLWWIKSARRSETRAERIAKTVRMAAENRLPN